MPANWPCLAISAIKVDIAARDVTLYACCHFALATSAIMVSIAASNLQRKLHVRKHRTHAMCLLMR